ncbi:hypothetical protein IAU60_001519 [Kwoniella sp. DSM 27419]
MDHVADPGVVDACRVNISCQAYNWDDKVNRVSCIYDEPRQTSQADIVLKAVNIPRSSLSDMAFERYPDRLGSSSRRSELAGPSRGDRKPSVSSTRRHSATPIIIDSDDDLEEVEVHQVEDEQGGIRRLQRNAATGLDVEARDAIRVALSRLDAEIKSVEDQLRPLQELHSSLSSERAALESQLSVAKHQSRHPSSLIKPGGSSSIDYQTDSFPFTPAVMQILKTTFHLSTFRLCQEGVINAAVDERDIVCVMPTGGGKSLTYQLPAVMGRGLTVVISPLLALIWDQVRAMKELGVECVMMTGGTSTSEQNEIHERMKTGGSRSQPEIRLCYVTPEKISKSKRLISTLERVSQEGRLHEAHCCSQLGHDFRPDYKKLSMLKTLFPRVPIQAVTATLSSKTLPDLLKILRLGPITDGRSAKTTGTVFFSAPLFRPNLHYQVLSKPSSAKAAIAAMGTWIQANHPAKSGIIYCLSKKDAETVADDLRQWSSGAIKTGVYHAGIDDSEKERIHVRWREGNVNCICATIAFGLGIDKGDVRYMSKSLEGYYQETGRAGRDGQDSDCVLFYRGQDASRLSSLTYGDVDGSSKLQEMLRFAQNLRTCRKVAFARYFSASAHLSASAWDHADSLLSSSGATSTCGICDNCWRPPDSIITQDVTVETWKILKVSQMVQREGGRVTLANLADLVRGLGGGSFSVVGGGEGTKGKRKIAGEKAQIDLDDVGGKVTMSKDDTEALLTHLVLLGYLADSYSATAYSVNVYIVPSENAVRLTRLSLEDIQAGRGVKIECTFPAPEAKKGKNKGKSKSKRDEVDGYDDEGEGDDIRRAGEMAKLAKASKRTSMTGGQVTKERVQVTGAKASKDWWDIDPDDAPAPTKKSRTAPERRKRVVPASTLPDETRNETPDRGDEEPSGDEWDEDGWDQLMKPSEGGWQVMGASVTGSTRRTVLSVSDSE